MMPGVPASSPPVLEVRNLRVAFEGNAVLRGVNLSVPRGQLVALIGLGRRYCTAVSHGGGGGGGGGV